MYMYIHVCTCNNYTSGSMAPPTTAFTPPSLILTHLTVLLSLSATYRAPPVCVCVCVCVCIAKWACHVPVMWEYS